MASTDNRIGPLLTIVASCLDCDRLRFDFDVYRCAHPKASSVAEPMLCSATREPTTPAWCPELPAARLALARSVVTEGPCDYCRARDKGHATFARGCTCATKEPGR